MFSICYYRRLVSLVFLCSVSQGLPFRWEFSLLHGTGFYLYRVALQFAFVEVISNGFPGRPSASLQETRLLESEGFRGSTDRFIRKETVQQRSARLVDDSWLRQSWHRISLRPQLIDYTSCLHGLPAWSLYLWKQRYDLLLGLARTPSW